MNWTRRRYEIAAAVPVLAVFGALYVWALPTDGEAMPDVYLWMALLFLVPTQLWVATSWVLVHHWWQGAGRRLSTMDAPGHVLAATVGTLPEPRQRWGDAMLGELTQVQGRSARWRFALSCARAALSLSLPAGLPVLAIAAGVAVAAVTAAHTVVSATLPGVGFFAASFVAVLGALVVLAIARARRVRLPVPAATVLVTGAVATSIAALAVFLLQHPAAAEGLTPAKAAFLAVALAGCLWLAVAPPRRLASSRVAPHVGVGGAVIFTLGVLAASRANVEGLPALWLIFGPMLTFGVPAVVAAAGGRSFRAGLQSGIWTAIAVVPLTWALGLFGALRQYAVDGTFRFAGDVVPAGFVLDFAFVVLVAIPVFGFPFAVIGATVGAVLRGAPPARNEVPEAMS